MSCFGRPARVAKPLSSLENTSATTSDWSTSSDTDPCMLCSCRRAAKHFAHVCVTWVRIVRSASMKMPRSRTHLTGDTRSDPTASGSEGSWPCRRAEAHHTTVLPSWMRLVEVDWNASNRRRQRHNQRHNIDHILIIFLQIWICWMAAILDFKMAEFRPDLVCVTNFFKISMTPFNNIWSQNEGTFQCTGSLLGSWTNKGKLDPRCTKDIFLGYDKGSPAYLVYFPETGKVIKHKVVKFAMPAQSASEQKLTSHDDSTFVLHRNSSHNNNNNNINSQICKAPYATLQRR